jgi:hypothetical protein
MLERNPGASLGDPKSENETLMGLAALRESARPIIAPIFFCSLVCSSALLFLMEPMFAKLLLPLLGGTPAVWNTCMVWFQAFLLGAYAYGHWSIRWLGIRRQALLQLLLLVSAMAALPIALPHGWEPPPGRNPILWVMGILTVGMGFPYFAVATSAPVLQRWFSSTGHRARQDPYFLYTASNLGSMAALVCYPTLCEPLLRLTDQARFWSYGYVAMISMYACCAIFVGPVREAKVSFAEPIGGLRRARWVLLAMIPSSLLLGSTTFITSDISAVPLLWIAPLTLYLLSFALVFGPRPLLPHRLMLRMQPATVMWVALFMLGRVGQPVWIVLAVHLICLFVSAMACHGELAADRPSVARLTDYYLMMSIGGLLGGVFNALIAPLIFRSPIEYPIALIAACAICPRANSVASKQVRGAPILDAIWTAFVGLLTWVMSRTVAEMPGGAGSRLSMLALGLPVMATIFAVARRRRFVASLTVLFLVWAANVGTGHLLLETRSFFGIYRVVRNSQGPFNDIYHGTTIHGRQFVDGRSGTPVEATTALTYYTRTGPIGQVLTYLMATRPDERVEVVGLGVGSLAAYAGRGTEMTFFEIDPKVQWLAEDSGYFSYLQSARQRGAKVRIVIGDARLTLGQTADRSCDLLIIDAFCGDAIPVHLLTREAMAIYLSKLDRDGILAIHISNMYLNLLPVCSALASDAGCAGSYRCDFAMTPSDQASGKTESEWVVVARDPRSLTWLNADPRWRPLPSSPRLRTWTDDFSDIFGVFCWR